MSESGSPPKDTSLTIPHLPMADYKLWVQAQKESGHDRAKCLMLTHGTFTYYKNEETKREELSRYAQKIISRLKGRCPSVQNLRDNGVT